MCYFTNWIQQLLLNGRTVAGQGRKTDPRKNVNELLTDLNKYAAMKMGKTE
jgi:hypothetical protein